MPNEENVLNEAVEAVESVESIANAVEGTATAVEQTTTAVEQTNETIDTLEKPESDILGKLFCASIGAAVTGVTVWGVRMYKDHREAKRCRKLNIDVEALIAEAEKKQGIEPKESIAEKGKNFLKNKKQKKAETTTQQ